MGSGSTAADKAARRASDVEAGGGSGAGGLSDPNNSGIVRACDQCRIRKIRCDKESPCSNCRIANRQCSSTGAGQKPREARQRVLISTQYERKIDQIEDRLTSIEKLLRELTHATRNRSHLETPLPLHEHALPAASESAHSPSTTTADDTGQASEPSTPSAADLDTSAFEGNSSLTAHTQFASEFLEHAVERTSLRDYHPTMAAALSSLKQLVGLSQQQRAAGTATTTTKRRGSGSSTGMGPAEVRFAHQRVLPRGGFRELPMPPVTAVIPVLREIKETPPGTFTLISVCCFMAVENFAEACRRVYFALEDFSQATFIIVNAGLYYLFQEKAVTAESDAAVREYTGYYELCRANLETGLAHLKFFLGASMETIEALLLGASYAIEVSRPSLAWQLNTTAAQLCQDLGYHRVTGGTIVPAPAPTPAAAPVVLGDKKAILFWFSYMLDRGLALRLGRAPTIQDFDVTLPRVIGRVNATEMWKEILKLWIAHADVQGRIYEMLYSPSSLGRPVAVRVEAARGLAAELKAIAEQARVVRAAEIRGGGWAEARKAAVSEMVMKSDQVSFLSSLTLVYRALPPGAGAGAGEGRTFTVECIETARMAMQTHEECMRMMGSNLWVAASYIHWTILYAPFVPFIVIFCHIIETSDVTDLHRLRDFIDSLQPTCAVSEGIEKLHRLFSVLYNVAMLYVEAKRNNNNNNSNTGGGGGPHNTQDTDMGPIGNEFDVYLSALGFMPVDEPPAVIGGGGGALAGAPPLASPLASPTSADGSGRFPAGAMAVQQQQQQRRQQQQAQQQAQQQQQQQQQANQLGDWFSGNRYMMGLLEEDLSQFHPGTWNHGGV